MRTLKVCLLLLLSIFAAEVWAQSDDELTFGVPEKLPDFINSNAEENTPYITNDGQTLYFVRTFHEENTGGLESGQDIWYTTYNEGTWSAPANDLPNINNIENNVIAGISPNDSLLYVLYSYGTNIKLNRGIASTRKLSKGWSIPRREKINKLPIYNGPYGFHIDRSGKILLLSIRGKDALGEEDLYVSFLDGKSSWSKPINLGPVVNSTGYEMSPFLAPDGKTLFYSSNGKGGLGDADIFMVERLDSSWTNWSEPVNLGSPINSSEFDAYFSLSVNEMAFFASNRGRELCDLYQVPVTLPKPPPPPPKDTIPTDTIPTDTVPDMPILAGDVSEMRGILEVEDRPIEGVRLVLLDKEKNIVGFATTDAKGEFRFERLNSEEVYFVKVDEEDQDYVPTKLVMLDQGGHVVPVEQQSDEETFAFTATEDVDVLPQDDSELRGTILVDEEPKAGVRVKILNEKNELVGTAVTNRFGQFDFKKLDPDAAYIVKVDEEDQELVEDIALVITDRTGEEVEVDTEAEDQAFAFRTEADPNDITESISGEVKAGDEPVANKRIEIVDDKGETVGYTTTDQFGKFDFKKLDPDAVYFVKVDEEDGELMEDISMVIKDDTGGEMVVEADSENQTFEFKTADPNATEAISGEIKSGDEPVANKRIEIVDDKGETIGYTTTDQFGKFDFKKLNADAVYFVKVEEEDGELMEDISMVIKDDTGGEMVLNTEDSEQGFGIKTADPNATEAISGEIKSGDAPVANKRIEIVDDKGETVGYTTTDQFGKFDFKKLDPDAVYFVKVDEEDGELMEDISMIIKDTDGDEVVVQANEDDEAFGFRTTNPEATESVSGVLQSGDAPVEGVKLKIYNEQNEVIGYTTTDQFGKFDFKKLNPDEIYIVKVDEEDAELAEDISMLITDNTGEEQVIQVDSAETFAIRTADPEATEVVTGTLQQGEAPVAGVKLRILNEKNEVVGYTTTDNLGNFDFKKLNPEKVYMIQLDEEDAEIAEDISMVLTDTEGETVTVEKMEVEQAFAVKMNEPKPLNLESISGKLQAKQVGVGGVRLEITDENNDVVGYVTTNNLGEFNFTKLDPEAVYFVKIDEEDIPEDLALIVTNESGEELEVAGSRNTFSFTFRPKILEVTAVEDTTTNVRGVLHLGDRPASEVKIKIMDDNNQLVALATTDEYGNFDFKKLDPDAVYIIKLEEDDAELPEDARLFLVNQNNKGEKTVEVADSTQSDGFVIATAKVEKKEVKPEIPILAANEAAKLKNPERLTLFFHFNSIHINESDERKLNQIARIMRKNPEMVAYINGHSDNLGTEEWNEEVSRLRAVATNRYLISMGIPQERLRIQIFGATYPLATNKYWWERAKNRRVEIVYGRL